jgi:ferredoxin-fold anticodon binding domain-containing protein
MKTSVIVLAVVGILALGLLSFPERKALAEKSTSYFIIFKVDHVDSLSEAGDQKAIMERAIELLRGKLEILKLKSAELRQKAKDIIILSYQGNRDPRKIVESIQPKDLVVSLTVVGIFKGQEIPEASPR